MDTDPQPPRTNAYGEPPQPTIDVPRAPEDDAPLEPGTLVAERYRIGRQLGEGGMGSVYFAEHVRVGRAVAVKVLSSQWAGVEHVARRFRDEARAASAAGHPNIIEVFDAGELPDGRPYLVMEHLQGRELYQEVQRCGRLEVERACRIIRDVARALQAAHEAGIIHRDLKGENVMLVERGGQELVKVLDFGIAANASAVEGRVTRPGQIMGTPLYMAPEQADGAPVTAAFDVYALGVLLHETLTGRTPFDDKEGMAVLVAKLASPAPSIATLVDDLPEDLVALVDACLAREPAARPGVGEIVQRLDVLLERPRTLAHAMDRVTGPTMRLPPPAEAARARRRWLVPAVLVTLLSLGAGAWALHDDAPAGEPASRRAGLDAPPVAPPEGPEVVPSVQSSASSGEAEGTSGAEATSGGPEPAVVPEAEGAGTTGAAAPSDPSEPEPEARVAAPSREPTAGREPAASDGLCWRTRKQARQAREAHDWTGVLRHTRSASCWTSERDDRRRLRAKAYMELGQWGACVEASRDLRDDQGQQWHRVCRRRQEQQQ